MLTNRELLAHVRALAVDRRFARNFNQLADLRDVTDLQVTAATIREMVKLNPFGTSARRALVVTSDVVFGMARMYQILLEESSYKFEIFREVDQAFQWLGIAEAKAELLSALSEASPIPGLD